MRYQHLLRILAFSVSLICSSDSALATADAETPEQELEILRLILLEKEVHTVLALMREAGCIWHSEFIWFYAPEKVNENSYRWGGEFVLQFEAVYSPEKSIRFSFSGEHSASGKTIDSVDFLSSERFTENCG